MGGDGSRFPEAGKQSRWFICQLENCISVMGEGFQSHGGAGGRLRWFSNATHCTQRWSRTVDYTVRRLIFAEFINRAVAVLCSLPWYPPTIRTSSAVLPERSDRYTAGTRTPCAAPCWPFGRRDAPLKINNVCPPTRGALTLQSRIGTALNLFAVLPLF